MIQPPYSPQAEKHLTAGDRNRQLARKALDSGKAWVDPPPHEWAIAMAFYAALHYVDAYCCQKASGSLNSHQARNNFVNTATDLASIAPTYNRLYSRSRIARYDPGALFRRGEVQALLNDVQYIRAEILKVM